MTNTNNPGYAFTLSLPEAVDQRLREWAIATPGATWDRAGGHVTLARLSGDASREAVLAALGRACADVEPFLVDFSRPIRAPYWGKPGLEIVMLVGASDADVASVLELRYRILGEVLALGLDLMEGGDYIPHVTLTTGQPEAEAAVLERSASGLTLRFTAAEVVCWSASADDGEWGVVDRIALTG